MARSSVTVLFDTGLVRVYTKLQHESPAEFSGRLLCAIEDAMGGPQNGRRWCEWAGEYTDGLGVMYQHTGARYVDRKRRIPGLYSMAEACAAFGVCA